MRLFYKDFRKLSLSSGLFHCPECNSNTRFEKVITRNYYVVFGLKIPSWKETDERGVFNECSNCNHSHTDNTMFSGYLLREDYDKVALKMFALMVVADDEILESEIETMQRLANNFRIDSLSKIETIETIKSARNAEDTILQIASTLKELQIGAKLDLFRALFEIATCDGHFDETEETLLFEIGTGMGIPNSEYSECLEELKYMRAAQSVIN